MYETKFTKKCKAALDAFQKEMGAYGLTVSRCTGGRYNDDACTSFHLVMETIAVPSKGKKDLIEALEKSGYWTEKYTRKEKDGRMYFVFVAHKSVDIETGPESLDKVEPEYKPEYFRPDVGTTYENKGGGRYQCIEVWNSGLTFSPAWDARMINTATGWSMICHGMLIYPDGTIEWDYSSSGRFEEGVR